MAHLHNTMIRKQLVSDAAKKESSLQVYTGLVAQARKAGHSTEAIIQELAVEKQRIQMDIRAGDPLFLQGVRNCQTSCVASIDVLISELKGEL